MNYENGFAEIIYNDRVFELKPTLSNIEKIGSPKEIVKILKKFAYRDILFVDLFRDCANVLQCCGLTEELTGHAYFSERSSKSKIKQGKIPYQEVFILAEHCLMHGVCGIIEEDDKDSDKTGKPLEEFHASDYIVDAIEILGLSLGEAENITMTQFIKLAKAKMKLAKKRSGKFDEEGNEIKSNDQRKKEEEEALSFYHSVVSKVNEVGISELTGKKPEESGSILKNISAQDTINKIRALEASKISGE